MEGVHTFSKGIIPKVNLIPRLEFERVYFETAIQHINHCATENPPGDNDNDIYHYHSGIPTARILLILSSLPSLSAIAVKFSV